MIQINNISKTYTSENDQVSAVHELSLSVTRGEFLAIKGPSGCGKSTLARALMGYCRPGSLIMDGEVRINNLNILQMNSLELLKLRGERIAMVPQNPLSSLTYHIKVGPQVDEILRIHQGMDSRSARNHTLELFSGTNLTDPELIYDRYPHEISGGQRQRVSIARALVNNPSILLADEPTGNLDSKSGNEIMEILDLLHKKGNTIILVTHEDGIAKHAHRTIRLFDGKITEDIRAGFKKSV